MVRSYDSARAVPGEILDEVLSAALRAPSAGDTQGVSFLVLLDRADIETYWQATTQPGAEDRWLRGMRTAPVLILVWTSRETYLDRYAEPDKGWTERDPRRWSAPYWFVDAGMASMAALLSAVDQRLAACFFGIPSGRVHHVREQFGVPADQLSVGVVSLGYPVAADPGDRNRKPRRTRNGRVHTGSWSQAE